MFKLTTKDFQKWNQSKVVNKCKVVDPNACPSEYTEQCNFVKWLTEQGYKFSAIPNSTRTTWSECNKNTATGVRAGLPDMVIIVGDRLVWVEMKKIDRKSKTGKGMGGVSEVQQEWIDALNKCNNCQAFVCYGFEEAKSVIEKLEATVDLFPGL